MKQDNKTMMPIIDLMWTVEDDYEVAKDGNSHSIKMNCGGGGGCCVACCCDIPSIVTKWLCCSGDC